MTQFQTGVDRFRRLQCGLDSSAGPGRQLHGGPGPGRSGQRKHERVAPRHRRAPGPAPRCRPQPHPLAQHHHGHDHRRHGSSTHFGDMSANIPSGKIPRQSRLLTAGIESAPTRPSGLRPSCVTGRPVSAPRPASSRSPCQPTKPVAVILRKGAQQSGLATREGHKPPLGRCGSFGGELRVAAEPIGHQCFWTSLALLSDRSDRG